MARWDLLPQQIIQQLFGFCRAHFSLPGYFCKNLDRLKPAVCKVANAFKTGTRRWWCPMQLEWLGRCTIPLVTRHDRLSLRPSGCTSLPMAILTPRAKSSHLPAEVVTVMGEIGHRFMDTPVFAGAIRSTGFARIAASVRPMPSLHKRRVHAPTHRGLGQRCGQSIGGPKDRLPIDRNNAAALPRFTHRRAIQRVRQTASRHVPRSARPTELEVGPAR